MSYCYKCLILLVQENKIKNRNLCKKCSRQICKDYKAKNKDLISEYNRKYKQENKSDIAKYNHTYHERNKETILQRHNIYYKNRLKTDPQFKLAHTCRQRLYKLLKGKRKSIKLIDCSMSFLKEWLESNFTEGMTFDNHGSYWHVDHVIPCSLFDLTNEDEINKCFKWTNLQPLEGKINMSKKNKICQSEVINHYDKVKKFATLKNIDLNIFDYSKYF
jgi:hypothetical protein